MVPVRLFLVASVVMLLHIGSNLFAQEPERPREDPEVMPAQFVSPSTSFVPDPPTPQVRIQLRVPSHLAPGKDITYRLYVTNASAADAFRVVVRNPIPEGIKEVVATDPKPDELKTKPAPATGTKELLWNLGTLRAGEKREIEITLRPNPGAKEVRNQAYVSFEHGQSVTTQLQAPKLLVRKAAPKEAVVDEPLPVRIEIVNTGRVVMTKVELVENIPEGLTFAPETSGEKGATPNQRVWRIGRLVPGERQYIDYRIVPKTGGELLTTSAVRSHENPTAEQAESVTKLLVPGLQLDFTGPASLPAGESANYEIVVRNTGTLPLSNVRVQGLLPHDCTPTKMTNGGRLSTDRDTVGWLIARLEPGSAQSYRLGLKSEGTGKRTVRTMVRDSRGLEKSKEVTTEFPGAAVLNMQAKFNDISISVGQQGLLTVEVTNRGTDTAKNVKLRVKLPPEVRFRQGTPKEHQAATTEVNFDAVSIPPNRTETFTLTYQADKAARAWFNLELYADSLGTQPIRKDQDVVISGR